MTGLTDWFRRHRDAVFVAAILAILVTLLVPLPPRILDLLLTVSMALAVLILLTAVYVRQPMRFSVFPSVLLLLTAYRLAVNIATTRQILGNAAREGTRAAGDVIQAFGHIVAGAEPVIGFVIFSILVAVNFIVITKGSNRISEVAARFMLDALPGKQMAVDADLNAGLIQADEARKRRREIAMETDFYGAMDGAAKFVRGDAIAGILITLVNIVAGFAVGWMKHGMDPAKALATFTILTVGDGLVSQIPALIVSLAAALMVTRATAEGELGRDLLGQVFGDRKALFGAAAFLGILVVLAAFVRSPALAVQVLAVAGLLLLVARTLRKAAREREEAERRSPEAPPEPEPERVEGLLRVEPLELEVGAGLVGLVDPARGGTLLERITRLRRQLAVDLGLVLPSIRIRDNMELGAYDYAVKIRGVPVAAGKVHPDHLLAMDSGSVTGPIEGEPTRDPAFGLPAWWIAEARRPGAEALGYAVTDAISVLAIHLTEVLKRHAHELLTRDEVNTLIKNLKETNPSVVEEVVPGVLKPGEVQKVLQNLLREGVSIRDLATILETLGDVAARTREPEVLTENVRQALARTISRRYLERDGRIYAVTLDPKLEDTIKAATDRTEQGMGIALTPAAVARIAGRAGAELGKLLAAGHPPVILCSPPVRAVLKRIVDTVQPGVAVLSYNEIVKDVRVEPLGLVALE